MGNARAHLASMAGGWSAAGMMPSGLTIERWWPYGGTMLATFAWWKLAEMSFPSNAEELLAATGTVASVLVGFLVTAKAIVLGLTETRVFKKLAGTGYDEVFFGYLFEAEMAGIATLCITMLGFFVMAQPAGTTPGWFNTLWISGAILAMLSFMRVTHMIFKFLRHVNK
jgi:hypothetical protein